ncbi:MAG: NAD(P)/FAD-dependent oxidoreductase [Gaiellaceae bacterium]
MKEATARTSGPGESRDVVVVGAGIAGLAAAWTLRDRDVLVLEADERVGGRMKSEPRGHYWLSVGAHMFPGPGSVIDGLVNEMGLETLPFYGSLLGMAYRGKMVRGGRAETYPFRLPMSLAGRLSFIRGGLKMRAAAKKYNSLARQSPGETASDVRARLLAFLDDRSFAEFIGTLHPDAEAIFRATTNRLTAEPDQVSAGCMASLFAHVWSTGDVVLGRSLKGGAAELPGSLSDALGDSVTLGAEVLEVAPDNGLVRIRYATKQGEENVLARAAIVTTTADVARRVIRDLPQETSEALEHISYGPMAVMSILTNERRPMPWDDVYSILVVGKSFNMFFNHASALRVPGSPRQPGGTLMVYGGAGLARRLFEKSDEGIRDTMLSDLHEIFPESRGIVEDVLVQRWTHTVPFASPGRHLVQQPLERPVHGSIFLAGDYIGAWTDIESAATTGIEAAGKVRKVLAKTTPASGVPTLR